MAVGEDESTAEVVTAPISPQSASVQVVTGTGGSKIPKFPPLALPHQRQAPLQIFSSQIRYVIEWLLTQLQRLSNQSYTPALQMLTSAPGRFKIHLEQNRNLFIPETIDSPYNEAVNLPLGCIQHPFR